MSGLRSARAPDLGGLVELVGPCRIPTSSTARPGPRAPFRAATGAYTRRSAHEIHPTAPWLSVGLAALLALPALAGAASISQVGTGFSGPGLLKRGGVVLIGGLVRCTDGPVRVDVTIRQGGRRARGTWRGPCTGANQRWGRVAARPATRARLRPGTAQACANATIRKPGLSVGTGWCGPVRLVRR